MGMGGRTARMVLGLFHERKMELFLWNTRDGSKTSSWIYRAQFQLIIRSHPDFGRGEMVSSWSFKQRL